MIIGYTISLLSAICYGSGQVIAKWGVGLSPPIVGATISLFCGVVVLYLVGGKDFASGLKGSGKALFFVLVAGALSAGGVVLLYQALCIADVATVTAFSGTTPVFTILGSYIFLKQVERISFGLLFGCVFIVIGSVLITLGR